MEGNKKEDSTKSEHQIHRLAFLFFMLHLLILVEIILIRDDLSEEKGNDEYRNQTVMADY